MILYVHKKQIGCDSKSKKYLFWGKGSDYYLKALVNIDTYIVPNQHLSSKYDLG